MGCIISWRSNFGLYSNQYISVSLQGKKQFSNLFNCYQKRNVYLMVLHKVNKMVITQ